MEAVVLAGGKGTRLRSVVSDVPKPMAPVAGRPFLEYILLYLAKNGVKRIVFSVGYKWEIIKEHFGDHFQGMDLIYSVEDEPLGTGGAIKKALAMINGKKALIINGDTFFDVPLESLIESAKSGSRLVLSLKSMKNFDRYGCVETDDNGHVTAFREKEKRVEGNINGGIYLVSTDIFDTFSLPEVFSFETFMQDEREKLGIDAQTFDSYFIDIGIPEDYARVQTEIGEHF